MTDGVYEAYVGDWRVSWETLGGHRLWCNQEHPSGRRRAAVVMLNPGSLSGSGERLGEDTTLRILREIFLDTGYSPVIVNLFTLVTTSPSALFERWDERNHPEAGRGMSRALACQAVLYAYGAYGVAGKFASGVNDRICEVRRALGAIPEIQVPLAKTKTPKHPIRIQIERLKEEFRQRIVSHARGRH